MNTRDAREHRLKAKLTRIAADLGIEDDQLLALARKYELFRDIREVGNEITINVVANSSTDTERAKLIATEVVTNALRRFIE